MTTEVMEKPPQIKSKAELEIGRWLGCWNRENLARATRDGLAEPEEKLMVEKIMPFITDADLRQKGMAENDVYAWKADTFLQWLAEQGLTLPESESTPLKQKQIAA